MKILTRCALLLALAALLVPLGGVLAAESEAPPGQAQRDLNEDDPDLPQGANHIRGTPGNDSLQGTDASDFMEGEGGDDHLNGAEGDDEVNGGSGDDHLQGGGGNDKINGGIGNDRMNGGEGNDTIRGGEGNDHINGGDGDDHIYGGEGDDLLEANPGRDIIEGNDGDDILIGGEDADAMVGNEGADTYMWLRGHAVGGPDVIRDFHTQQGDKLDFTELLAGDGYTGDGSYASIAGWLRARGQAIQYDATGQGQAFVDLVVLEHVRPDIQAFLENGTIIVVGGGKQPD